MFGFVDVDFFFNSFLFFCQLRGYDKPDLTTMNGGLVTVRGQNTHLDDGRSGTRLSGSQAIGGLEGVFQDGSKEGSIGRQKGKANWWWRCGKQRRWWLG